MLTHFEISNIFGSFVIFARWNYYSVLNPPIFETTPGASASAWTKVCKISQMSYLYFLQHAKHSWQRVPNLAILWRYPPFQICPTLPFLSLPTPTTNALFVVLFLWLNRWSHHIWYAISLQYYYGSKHGEPWHRIPEGSWCVLYERRHQEFAVWYIMCFFAGTLIWYHTNTHTHTHTHTHTNTHAHSTLMDQ